jgi:hypothetical protein
MNSIGSRIPGNCPSCGSANGLRLCLRCSTAYRMVLNTNRDHEPQFCEHQWHLENGYVGDNDGIKLVPNSWGLVKAGVTSMGDKYWSYERLAWLPVTVNGAESGRPVAEFAAVIRRSDGGR